MASGHGLSPTPPEHGHRPNLTASPEQGTHPAALVLTLVIALHLALNLPLRTGDIDLTPALSVLLSLCLPALGVTYPASQPGFIISPGCSLTPTLPPSLIMSTTLAWPELGEHVDDAP